MYVRSLIDYRFLGVVHSFSARWGREPGVYLERIYVVEVVSSIDTLVAQSLSPVK